MPEAVGTPSISARFARTARRLACGLGLAGVLGLWLPGCAARSELKPTGMNSFGQAQRYIKKAVRSSSEGVIILPSRRAENIFDLQRLNDIAQALRAPAAACFINRAILTMKRGKRDGEDAYVDVPEGQIKLRVRLSPDGEVLRTEVLDTGFKDTEIEPCLKQAIEARTWIPNRTGMVQYLDVIYWVSLGDGSEDRSPKAQAELRRQQAIAAMRGKGCFAGRAAPGTYKVEGLNLLDREGNTLVNRVDSGALPEKVRQCLAVAFQGIRMPRAPQAFVRPVAPRTEFMVAAGGEISFADEQWISLLLLEEQALRDERRAEVDAFLGEAKPEVPLVDTAPPTEPEPDAPATPAPAEPALREPAAPVAPAADPSRGGLKLKLGGHRKPGS